MQTLGQALFYLKFTPVGSDRNPASNNAVGVIRIGKELDARPGTLADLHHLFFEFWRAIHASEVDRARLDDMG